MNIDQATVAFIKRFEGCSLRPNWAGGQSGIDIGYGCDIGADPDSLDAWKGLLDPGEFSALQAVKGIAGLDAKALLSSLSAITISQSAADAVLTTYSLPKVANITLRAFPGADELPEKSFGALISLVYNRGASTTGPRRQEMAEIKELIAVRAWDMIPVEFSHMARYWNDGIPTDSNLPGRRYAEGHLFESGLRDAGLADAATLLLGDSGDAVKALQRALKVASDGSFGPATLRAVIAWQHKQGTPEHGIADPPVLCSLRL